MNSLRRWAAVKADDGLPLGVVRLDGYAPESAKGKDPGRPVEEKDSNRWLVTYKHGFDLATTLPDTRFISVADREGDIFERFDLHRQLPEPEALLPLPCTPPRNLWFPSADYRYGYFTLCSPLKPHSV